MTKEWETKELAAVSAINYGYTESASSEPVGPRFLRITDIQDDRVDWGSVPYCRIEPADLPKYRLASGDIVFARTGATTGKSFLVDDPPDAVFASYLIRLRLLDKNLLPKFVALFFQTAGYWQSIKDGSSGSAQGGFNATKLGALKIPVPPLSEQQRIVGILDEAFEGIATAKANAEKNLQNAKAIFESDLQAVFANGGKSWISSTLGGVIRFIDYRGKTPVKTASGIRLITAKNVKMGYVQETPREFIASANYRSWMTRGIPRKGDVLFTTEAPLANVAQLDTDEKVAFAQRIIVMQPEKTKLNKTFLKYLLLSGPVQQRIRARGTGATVQGIKARLLKLIEISFPKVLAEQAEIVEKLDALSEETQRLASVYEQKLDALEALKRSLLHQAFAGKL
jgi:type I restriction enzyme, S subunit